MMEVVMRIFTIGHSTHSIDDFVAMLLAHGVEQVVDIRTIAKSRHNPQFAETEMKKSLLRHDIAYARLEKLGGLRHTTADSVNTAWRNKSFRGYADYMQTAEFTEGLEELMNLAEQKPTAIMCAEAVPWRCHRSLVGDALLVRKVEVLDIMAEKSAKPHKLTPFAVVDGMTITYPENV